MSSSPICDGPSSPIETPARLAQRRERFAVGPARRNLVPELVARKLELAVLDLDFATARLRLGDLDDDVADAPELLDRLRGVVERLAVPAQLVLDRLDAL